MAHKSSGTASRFGARTLGELAESLIDARERAAIAGSTVVAIEDEIAIRLGHKVTPTRVESGGFLIVTQSRNVQLVIDEDVQLVVCRLGAPRALEVFPLRHALDVDKYEALRKSDPNAFEIASRAVQIKPAKPRIDIQRKEG